jgi:hypothetical protein
MEVYCSISVEVTICLFWMEEMMVTRTGMYDLKRTTSVVDFCISNIWFINKICKFKVLDFSNKIQVYIANYLYTIPLMKKLYVLRTVMNIS